MGTADFTCRLPVVTESTGGDFVTFSGGFVSFPSATFKADPAGKIHSRYLQQDFATAAKPVLYGGPQAGNPFYDLARHRWLPVSSAQAAPDGASYASATAGATSAEPAHIRVVNVAHGTTKVYAVPVPNVRPPAGIQVADFDGSGVLFVVNQFEQYPSGVWRLDVATGSVRARAQVANVMLVRGRYAWVGRMDPRDPSPPRAAASGALFDSVIRVDLASGAEVVWYYRPGKAVAVRGLDAGGNPVVSVASGPALAFDASELRLVDAPGGTGSVVFNGGHWLSEPQADNGRLWFGNDRGIYLYTPARGLRKVFAFNGNPTLGEAIFPAGDCRT
jgi:hypothetical protein